MDNINEKANMIFYDGIDPVEYEKVHQCMIQEESEFWSIFNRQMIFPHDTILEFGAGTGFVSEIILTNILPVRYYCIDSSVRMQEFCEKRLKRFKCCKIYGFITEQIDTESVDLIVVNSALHHVKDLDQLYGEFHRILKPRGILIFSCEPNKDYPGSAVYYVYNYVNYIMTMINGIRNCCKGENYNSEDKVMQEISALGDPKKVIDEMEYHANTGIQLPPKFLFDEISKEVYGHCGKFRPTQCLLFEILDWIMRVLFYKNGYNVRGVYKKRCV